MSGETYEKIQADFPGAQPEKLALKGFKDAVAAYRLGASARPPRFEEGPEEETKRAISWGAVVFGLLGAPCAVATLIGPLAVALGLGALFGLGGALTFLDQSPIRIPVLILAALAAFANLYTVRRARRLRAELEARGEFAGMTALERRRTLLVVGAAVATLGIVVFEIIAHIYLHDSPL
jgi:hypothetical protein